MDPLTAFLIRLVVTVVLAIVGTLAQQAFAKDTQRTKTQTGTRGSVLIGGRIPQYFLIGTVGEAGKREYRNAWGNSGEVPNAYNVDVYSFGDIPISTMTGLFVNGVSETVSGSNHVTQGYPTTGDKAGRLWVEFFDGTQETASSYLTNKFGSDEDRPWGSDMIGIGIPYIIVTALWDQKIWTGYPSVVAEFQGIPLYDPREDSTAGGSGSQRWDDNSTWGFSDNVMVAIYNIERGIYYEGDHIWGGNRTEAQMPYSPWAAAMDACDEDISLDGGGTEKRFRCGRRINLNERPSDIIKELAIAANSRLHHSSDGSVYPLVGVPESADGAFNDDDVLATNKLGTIPFPNLDSVVNGAVATYREPQQAWEDKETSPYYRSDLELLDDGRRQIEELNLNSVFSGTQAQRVLKAVVEESRRFRRHVVQLPPEFAVYRPLNVLSWTSDQFDYSSKLFLVTVRTRDIWGNVIFGLQEIDPADHVWSAETDENELNFAPVVTNRPAPQEVSGFSVSPAIDTRPAIDVFWSTASVAVDVSAVRITIATDDGTGAPDAIVWEAPAVRPSIGSIRIAGDPLLRNKDYVVQIQYIPFSGRETTPSSWIQVTTPNVGLTDSDFAQSVQDRLDYTSELLRSLQEQLINLDVTLASQESWSRDVSVKQTNALATVVRQTEVLLENNYASASDLTLLTARVGQIDASALLSAVATVDEGEGLAEMSWRVRVTDSDSFVEAGIGVGVLSGVGYAFIDADKTFFTGTLFFGDAMEIDTDTGGLSIEWEV